MPNTPLEIPEPEHVNWNPQICHTILAENPNRSPTSTFYKNIELQSYFMLTSSIQTFHPDQAVHVLSPLRFRAPGSSKTPGFSWSQRTLGSSSLARHRTRFRPDANERRPEVVPPRIPGGSWGGARGSAVGRCPGQKRSFFFFCVCVVFL